MFNPELKEKLLNFVLKPVEIDRFKIRTSQRKWKFLGYIPLCLVAFPCDANFLVFRATCLMAHDASDTKKQFPKFHPCKDHVVDSKLSLDFRTTISLNPEIKQNDKINMFICHLLLYRALGFGESSFQSDRRPHTFSSSRFVRHFDLSFCASLETRAYSQTFFNWLIRKKIIVKSNSLVQRRHRAKYEISNCIHVRKIVEGNKLQNKRPLSIQW